MKKNDILISIIKLISVGMIAKILSVLVKIFLARKVGVESMSLYSLTTPTIILLINLAQAGFPTAITKLISQNRNKATKIVGTSIILSCFLNIILGVIYFSCVPIIANKLLHNSGTILCLYVGGLIMPFVSISGILKGYFVGIGKVEKSSYCQISEEIFRIIFIIIFIDVFTFNSPTILSAIAMLSMIIGEIASIIHLLISTKVKKIDKFKFYQLVDKKEKKLIQKQIINIAIPTTSTRIIGSISYFFEPIIFTSLMLKSGIDMSKITLEYGLINSYVMPLLLLPGFFANALSLALLPLMSKKIGQKDYKYAIRFLKKFTMYSFIIGLFFSIIILLSPSFFMNVLYGTTLGVEYIKKYAFLMLIYYIQAPLNTGMIAFSLEKNILIDSIINNIFKIICFIIFIPLFKSDGLIISVLMSVYLSVVLNIILINKKQKQLINKNN